MFTYIFHFYIDLALEFHFSIELELEVHFYIELELEAHFYIELELEVHSSKCLRLFVVVYQLVMEIIGMGI